MRFLIYIFSLLIPFSSISFKKHKDPLLRFDGVYYKEGVMIPGATVNRNFTYLRFYQDGTVIRVSSASKPEQIEKWFAKRPDNNIGRGKYHLNKNGIDFEVKYGTNMISHEGTIVQDTLKLTVYGSKNKASYNEDYYFVKVDFEK
jgi:hypothetical protein